MALTNGAKMTAEFQPQNNKQAYLAYMLGMVTSLPEPRTTEEELLYKLCVGGGAGGSSVQFTGIDGRYLFADDARMDKMDKILSMCSELTDLYGMFYGSKTKFAFDMSKIDTSKVTSVEMMFGASRVTSVDMSKNDMSACTDFTSMFHNCSDLEEIIGFSAPNHTAAGAIGFPKGSSSSKYKLKRLTFRTDLPCAIQCAIDIRNNSFNREGVVEMFNTLPDVTSLGLADYRVSIYIAGNPCVVDGTLTDDDRAIATNKGWTVMEE